MKKLIIVIVIVLALGLGVAPYFIGQQAEQEFRDIYAKVNATPELRVEVTDYQRGWFSSTAIVELGIDLADFDPTMTENLTFTMTNQIDHGPLLTSMGATEIGLIDIDTSLEFPAFILEEMPDFNESFNEMLSIKSRMYFNGATRGVLEMQESNFEQDGTSITVKPASLDATTTNDGQITASGDWGGMSISDNATFGFTMGDMEIAMDMKALGGNVYDPNALYVGSSSFTMASINVTGQDIPGMVELKQFTITSNNEIADNLMGLDLDLGMAEVSAMGMSFTDIVFNQTFSNLDVEALQKINQVNRQMSAGNIDAQMAELAEIAISMLEKKPTYQIRELGVVTAQGKIGSEMNASLDETLLDLNNQETILLALNIDGSGYVPEAFLTTMGMMPMVQPFVDQGYLTKDGENLTFEFSMKQGQMLMSGKPFPPTQ